MRPPTPAVTLVYKSPNACNLCHTDKSAQWADKLVRQWRSRDYQAPILQRASLIDSARKRDWSRLDAILTYIEDPASDPIFAVSLLRLLETCDREEKWSTVRKMVSHPHPLLRSSAATLLAGQVTQQNFNLLMTAAQDDFRLVRISVATALAWYPREWREQSAAKMVCEGVFKELEMSHLCRPDAWDSHYNLGNYYEGRGWSDRALQAYEQATRLRPDMSPPLVNAAMMQARRGDLSASLALLQRAESVDPHNPTIHLNLGMALTEQRDLSGAERHFRAALSADPSMAQAAYNLGILLNLQGPTVEGLGFCKKASELAPQQADYVYTYAYYLIALGRKDQASAVLRDALKRGVSSDEITSLIHSLYTRP